MVADDGGDADVVADEDGGEDEGYVHQHAVGRHAVLSQVVHQLQVVAHGDDVHRDATHVFRQSVAAGFAYVGPENSCRDDAEGAFVAAGREIVQWEQSAHRAACRCGYCRSRHSHS